MKVSKQYTYFATMILKIEKTANLDFVQIKIVSTSVNNIENYNTYKYNCYILYIVEKQYNSVKHELL